MGPSPLDASSFDANRFTVWVFAQPLYIPDINLTFSIGRRFGELGGGQEKWWTLTPDNEAAILARCRQLAQVMKLAIPGSIDDRVRASSG
jgi:hypothetical protein